MFDTMTLTKVVGGVCGTLLIFLLGKWVADELYHVGGGHGGDHASAYIIEIEEKEPVDVIEVPFADLLASADIGKGEKVWGKCRACHKLEAGENGTGPYLYGIVGRDVGAAEGFKYSGKLNDATDVWSTDALNAFLENPKGYAPGTSMSFKGLSKPVDRANVIAYLDSIGG